MLKESDTLDEILHGLEHELSKQLIKLYKGMPSSSRHFGQPFLRAKAKIQSLITEARIEQVMQDFMSLGVLNEGFNIDEAILIDWREQQLKELEESKDE